MRKYILAWILSVALIAPASAFAKAPPSSGPFPANAGSDYAYSQGDIPDICFFPAKKARWDGSKVTAASWRQLTGFQRMRFISEYAGELERQYGQPVDLEGGWGYLRRMNAYAAKACENGCGPEDRMTTALEALLFAKGLRGFMPPEEIPAIPGVAVAEPEKEDLKKLDYKLGIDDVTGRSSVRASNVKIGVDYKVSPNATLGVEATQGLHDSQDAAAWGKSADDETAAQAKYKLSF